MNKRSFFQCLWDALQTRESNHHHFLTDLEWNSPVSSGRSSLQTKQLISRTNSSHVAHGVVWLLLLLKLLILLLLLLQGTLRLVLHHGVVLLLRLLRERSVDWVLRKAESRRYAEHGLLLGRDLFANDLLIFSSLHCLKGIVGLLLHGL